MDNTLEFTGERFVPEVHGSIALEHLHRYLAAKALVSGKAVLDIACGEGYGSAMLAETAAGVTGVEIDEAVIDHARQRYDQANLSFAYGTCAAIPMASDTVDVVVSFETIEHHDDHQAMMQEVKRVLRPDGVLVISSPDKAEYSDKPGFDNPYHAKELYASEFQALLADYFQHQAAYGQRVLYGSALLGERSGGPNQTHAFVDDAISTAYGVMAPLYLLAVASDAALPELPGGVLEQDQAESELVLGLQAQHKVEIDQLNLELNRVKQALSELYSSRSWRITRPMRWLCDWLRYLRG